MQGLYHQYAKTKEQWFLAVSQSWLVTARLCYECVTGRDSEAYRTLANLQGVAELWKSLTTKRWSHQSDVLQLSVMLTFSHAAGCLLCSPARGHCSATQHLSPFAHVNVGHFAWSVDAGDDAPGQNESPNELLAEITDLYYRRYYKPHRESNPVTLGTTAE